MYNVPSTGGKERHMTGLELSGEHWLPLFSFISFSPKDRCSLFHTCLASHLLDLPRDPDDCQLPPLHGGPLDVELRGGGVGVGQLLQLGDQLGVVVVVGQHHICSLPIHSWVKF